jgi:hypothetical protein
MDPEVGKSYTLRSVDGRSVRVAGGQLRCPRDAITAARHDIPAEGESPDCDGNATPKQNRLIYDVR